MQHRQHRGQWSTGRITTLFLGLLSAGGNLPAVADMAPPVFSQTVVLEAAASTPNCVSASESVAEDTICHAPETAPAAGAQTIVATTQGRAYGTLVVTTDGYGSGTPVLAVPASHCPAGIAIPGDAAEQVGAEAEFTITPAGGGTVRHVSSRLLSPQAAHYLQRSEDRALYTLPALLQQPLRAAQPVDLGPVQAGDRIALQLYAIGTTTRCENGQLAQQDLHRSLWAQSSDEVYGYLSSAEPSTTWDDTRVVPFKATATVTYR